ncbi:MAG: phosphoribosyltransferase family protein [Chloroflexi bacterium]|nr:phosphoribosyltransferase family protein [Chloroflexota bacterium]
MASYYKVNNLTGDMLVPVPLNEKRIRDRGYNQSGLLAREISMLIGVPVNEKVIRRIRDCQPQARTKNVDERKRNMENAFSHTGDEVRGLDVVVIDDVCTSGATLEACASALKAAGAKRVTGFTLAREIKKQE